jgi:hypothetical protein
VQPWARAADGSATLTLSKPFDSPAQAAAIVKEISGTAGPLRDVTVTRDQGTFSTSYSATGTIDLKHLQTGMTADPQVVGTLFAQGIDAGSIDQALVSDLRDSFGLTVKVELPGRTTSIAGNKNKVVPINESTSVLDTTRVILVTVAIGLVVVAIVVLLWPRRRRRRPVSRRPGPVTIPGSAPASRAQSRRLPPAAHDPGADPS